MWRRLGENVSHARQCNSTCCLVSHDVDALAERVAQANFTSWEIGTRGGGGVWGLHCKVGDLMRWGRRRKGNWSRELEQDATLDWGLHSGGYTGEISQRNKIHRCSRMALDRMFVVRSYQTTALERQAVAIQDRTLRPTRTSFFFQTVLVEMEKACKLRRRP